MFQKQCPFYVMIVLNLGRSYSPRLLLISCSEAGQETDLWLFSYEGRMIRTWIGYNVIHIEKLREEICL